MITDVNENNYKAEVEEAGMPVLLDFFAERCGPCRMMERILEEAADERNDIKFCRINVDDVLREVGVEGSLCRFDFGALLQIGQEGLGHLKELVEVAAGAVLQVEGETVGGTVTGNHRRLEEEHLRILEHIA